MNALFGDKAKRHPHGCHIHDPPVGPATLQRTPTLADMPRSIAIWFNGSVWLGAATRHHIPEAQPFSVGLFCARKASVGAILGSRLRSVVLHALPFWTGFRPISSLSFICGPQERLRPVPYLARVCGEVVGVGDCYSNRNPSWEQVCAFHVPSPKGFSAVSNGIIGSRRGTYKAILSRRTHAYGKNSDTRGVYGQ